MSMWKEECDEGPPDAKPSEYTGGYWLWWDGPCSGFAAGKWMLFYHISRIDEAWERAKAQYREGLLPGVSGMKVSTAKPNSNARDPQVKVMIFYCGSESDEPGTLAVGRTILEQMQYTGPGCPTTYKRIYWKSDRATCQGIYSGRGNQRASSFSLPFPQPQTTAATSTAAAAAAAPAYPVTIVGQPQPATVYETDSEPQQQSKRKHMSTQTEKQDPDAADKRQRPTAAETATEWDSEHDCGTSSDSNETGSIESVEKEVIDLT